MTSIDSGWSPQCESYPANSSEWGVLKTTSVDWSGFNSSFNKKLPLELTPRKEIEVKPLDILVTRAGPTERVGVVSVVPHSVRSKLMISDKLIRLKSNEENNPLFLGISLSSVKCQNQLQSKTSGLAKSQTNISQKILGEVLLKLPSKEEQTKIASFLSAVDEKISQLTQKLELLSQYKQGMMQKLFSQQIRFKADDGSEFGEWENTVLGDIADIVGGGTPSTNNQAYWSGDVVWLTPSEINQKFIGESKRTISELGVQKSSAKKLPIGTILFTSRATIGEVAIAIAEVTTNQGFQSFISNEKTFNEFLYYWIVNNKKSFIERASGSTFLEISKSKIQPMEISLPCLEEQTKIANFLSAIDQKIEVVAQQIEQAKQWKKGLLQQMFI
ncbi:restriction endonuclease subunit S [Acinetobacter sp. YH12233]|uniref:restriction endonuclease subunit S n=1 Tax=Acinetobacter sp. YH12233 TaxID=2601161 RepID=UPI0035A1B31B